MSRKVAEIVYSRKIGSLLRKAVLAYFAERANDDGSLIFASKKTIAIEVECSKQAVISTVKAFVQEGLLVEKGRRQTHGGYTVVYDINLHVLEALPFAKTRHAFPNNQSKDRTGPNLDPAITLTGAVNPVDLDRSTQLTQTVHEPSLNHDAKASLPRVKAINEYPKPEWADPGVWADYLKNRKLKNKPNTATAYKRFCDDIARLANDEWPPDRLLEHAAAEGWAGIYDPRNKRGEQEGTSISGIGRTESAAKRLKQQISASSFGPAESGGGTSALRSELRDRLTHVSARPLRLGRHEHR